jgi:hypothetical protein
LPLVNDRLASSVVVSALLRLTQEQGGFGTVLAKGDAGAGAIILLIAERGRTERVMERILQPGGRYAWSESIRGAPNDSELNKFLERRRRFDPDLWLIELDVPSAERFAADMSAFD